MRLDLGRVQYERADDRTVCTGFGRGARMTRLTKAALPLLFCQDLHVRMMAAVCSDRRGPQPAVPSRAQ